MAYIENLPDTCEECEPATMPAHDLDDKRAGVRERGRLDVVDGFANTVKGGRRADGHVCHRHIVVYGADETDDLEMSVGRRLLF